MFKKLFKEIKLIFGRNWWAAIHANRKETRDAWFLMKVRSFFGFPMTTVFFRVAGPFQSEKEANDWIAERCPAFSETATKK